MIGRLTGKIEINSEDSVLIDVSGVGYLVFVSTNTISNLQPGSTTSLLIETHVREDHIQLFGFLNLEEKDCFLKLNLVSGVGTRVALAILSSMSPADIAASIARADKQAFKAVSGVGPKLAERIILELKDKNFISGFQSQNHTHIDNKDIINDAVSALSNLGLNKADAHHVVLKIIKEEPEIKLDDLIRKALQSR